MVGLGTDSAPTRLASGITVLDTWAALVQEILGSLSGEEVTIGYRQEVFKDIGPVADEVRDSQLLADRVLVLASTDEVHVAR